MFDALLHTPAAQALLLAAAGALAFWLRDVPGLALSWIKRFFITTLTLDSRDEFLFAALVEFMDAHPALRKVNQFTACRPLARRRLHISRIDECVARNVCDEDPLRRHYLKFHADPQATAQVQGLLMRRFGALPAAAGLAAVAPQQVGDCCDTASQSLGLHQP